MWPSVNACLGVVFIAIFKEVIGQVPPVPPVGGEYDDKGADGSYRFGFQTGDVGNHYRAEVASKENQVVGRFGARDPAKGRPIETQYTAGKRGFRARGPNIARQMDLSQVKIPYNPPVRPDSPNYKPTYSGYHDPNEDPSYKFGFRTATYSKQETSNSLGHVEGVYSFVDDVGERHDVRYEAGSGTGFVVKTAFPESKPFTGLFYSGSPGKAGGKPRGRSSIQQSLDGSYQFVANAPDHRRAETSDRLGNRRGSYTYLDDKGQQRTIEYIAGPNIGYKIVRKGVGPGFPPGPSFQPSSVYFPPFSPNFEGVDSGDFSAGGSSSRPKPGTSGSSSPGASSFGSGSSDGFGSSTSDSFGSGSPGNFGGGSTGSFGGGSSGSIGGGSPGSFGGGSPGTFGSGVSGGGGSPGSFGGGGSPGSFGGGGSSGGFGSGSPGTFGGGSSGGFGGGSPGGFGGSTSERPSSTSSPSYGTSTRPSFGPGIDSGIFEGESGGSPGSSPLYPRPPGPTSTGVTGSGGSQGGNKPSSFYPSGPDSGGPFGEEFPSDNRRPFGPGTTELPPSFGTSTSSPGFGVFTPSTPQDFRPFVTTPTSRPPSTTSSPSYPTSGSDYFGGGSSGGGSREPPFQGYPSGRPQNGVSLIPGDLPNNCCRPRPSSTSISLSSINRSPPNFDDIYLQSPSFSSNGSPIRPPNHFRPTYRPPSSSSRPYSEFALSYDRSRPNGKTTFREKYNKDDDGYSSQDKRFFRTPGTPVRALVQSVDLLPYGSRIPSPGEAFDRDRRLTYDKLR